MWGKTAYHLQAMRQGFYRSNNDMDGEDFHRINFPIYFLNYTLTYNGKSHMKLCKTSYKYNRNENIYRSSPLPKTITQIL